MSEWKPIQTAPVGTPILVWGPEDEFAVAEYEGRSNRACHLSYSFGEYCDVYPTHWMPLPEPPK